VFGPQLAAHVPPLTSSPRIPAGWKTTSRLRIPTGWKTRIPPGGKLTIRLRIPTGWNAQDISLLMMHAVRTIAHSCVGPLTWPEPDSTRAKTKNVVAGS
jgi:hypothetical protein